MHDSKNLSWIVVRFDVEMQAMHGSDSMIMFCPVNKRVKCCPAFSAQLSRFSFAAYPIHPAFTALAFTASAVPPANETGRALHLHLACQVSHYIDPKPAA